MKNRIPHSADRLAVLPEPGFTVDQVARLGGDLSGLVLLCHERDRESLALSGATLITYGGMHFCPSRRDLEEFRPLAERFDACTLVHRFPARSPNHFSTALRLLGFRRVEELLPDGQHRTSPQGPVSAGTPESLLFSFCGGIGNAVLASSVAASAARHGVRTLFCPVADITGTSLAPLFDPPPEGVTLVAPEDIGTAQAEVSLNVECHDLLGPEDFCHNPYRLGAPGHGPAFLADFVRNVTGLDTDLSATFVGGLNASIPERLQGRVVVCPGSKPGWDSKRWPHMNELLRRLDNPVVLCREPDLEAYGTLPFLEPISGDDAEFVTDFDLPRVAVLLRSAKMVVANDCGLAHVAAATGTPTLFLFGPSSLEQNLHPRGNVLNLALDLDCRPCQGKTQGPGRLAPNDYHCDIGFACLRDLSVDKVLEAMERLRP
ncbi:hypothetical protein GM415_09350 [Pseudodesulfovibrio cashew]|uniref:Glycosyltransferase family 9 protein n=1 Tax=Pseudodesulfovibrio cashew TaxID=2678688 RepID=A0A6I6JJ29_9BACT|nr:glycosyltransferase family 9 protein [Pseudodesulfovibrio cashew]QGY40322.1 hypothetical protein GM415_09350 [Pseudodesulfovibrio cashew]